MMILKEVTKFTPSSWHGTTIKTTPQSLVDLAEKWGVPYNNYNDGSEKTNFDFDFQASDDLQFTVYDWKEFEILDMDTKYRFHIGGIDEVSTIKAKNILTKLLNN
tara:strand:+ start:983 stop:1297 length:315 start_codon:yes stop_codon:yes gene_type:complete